jgi:hypothetical protein
MIKKFEAKTEAKLLGVLSKKLTDENQITEQEAVEIKDFLVSDRAVVIVIFAKSEEAKRLLCRYYAKDNQIDAVKNLDYTQDAKLPTKVRVSMDYFEFAVKLLKVVDDSIRITAKTDYPIVLEDDTHFKIIIAPRVEEDSAEADKKEQEVEAFLNEQVSA